MISALERRKRAAHHGDSDIVFFTFFYSDSYINVYPCMIYIIMLAPAGGGAAAAPEGGALAGPSASPHLPVVGAGNPA
jgi:hypothetical protein